MEFSKIALLFEGLGQKKKRIDKIVILRDFLLENPKEAPIIFDLIAGNYQRKIEKRKLGISLKTLFSVISEVSNASESKIETLFNKKGDIGIVAEELIQEGKGSNLLKKNLSLKQIQDAFEKISKTTGNLSNKRKKEVLSELFFSVQDEIEYKYLARLLIDDLRIGTSEGTLREACCCAIFSGVDSIEQTIKENSKEETKKSITIEEFIQLDNRTKLILENPRETYNDLLNQFEKKYNIIISFEEIIQELKQDKKNLFKYEIHLGKPFKSMLGPRSNTIEDAYEKTGKPALLDYKYDGLRVQIHNNKGNVTLYTRNLDNITKQFPEITEYIKDNFSNMTFVIDSECVGYDFNEHKFLPFQLLSRRILTKKVESVSHISVVVRAFDLLYLENKSLLKKPYKKRRELLDNLFIGRELKQKHRIKV